MKKLTVSLICSVFAFSSLSAQQTKSDWKLAATSKDHDYYINKKSTVTNESGIKQTWIMSEVTITELPKSKKRKPKLSPLGLDLSVLDYMITYKDQMILWEFDCARKLIRDKASVIYDKNGKVITSSNEIGKWQDVVPESIGYAILESVCKE
jgi:hypothetical protein